uniref:Uncharacterized protein n=1 Tax=Glossina pallidipes TaxID=7398 RepID=A0A1A9ZWM8_GLOPL
MLLTLTEVDDDDGDGAKAGGQYCCGVS